MATLENVSVEDLRQTLAEVDDADATKQLMAAITYKEIEDLTQAEAAALYGFSSSWASKWFNRLERLADKPFEEVVYDKPREGRPSELSDNEHEQFVEVLHESPEDVGLDAKPVYHQCANQQLLVTRTVWRVANAASLPASNRRADPDADGQLRPQFYRLAYS